MYPKVLIHELISFAGQSSLVRHALAAMLDAEVPCEQKNVTGQFLLTMGGRYALQQLQDISISDLLPLLDDANCHTLSVGLLLLQTIITADPRHATLSSRDLEASLGRVWAQVGKHGSQCTVSSLSWCL